jgi:nucleoside-diphosphate-sugar epimerase
MRVQRFINASSSTVYGLKNETRVHEGLSLAPISIYGKLKAKYEPYVEELNDKNFVTVSLRPGTVCGLSPRQRFDVLVNMLTIHALVNKKIRVHGGGQFRTNITNDDMVNIYKLMLEAPAEKIFGEKFNVSFENYKVLETAEIIRDVIGNNTKIEIDENVVDKRSYRLDSSKFIERFNYKQVKTVRDAVGDIASEFEKGRFYDGLINDKYYDIRTLKNRINTLGRI